LRTAAPPARRGTEMPVREESELDRTKTWRRRPERRTPDA
jgi:hypothetical protein